MARSRQVCRLQKNSSTSGSLSGRITRWGRLSRTAPRGARRGKLTDRRRDSQASMRGALLELNELEELIAGELLGLASGFGHPAIGAEQIVGVGAAGAGTQAPEHHGVKEPFGIGDHFAIGTDQLPSLLLAPGLHAYAIIFLGAHRSPSG